MLVWDSFRAHLADPVKRALGQSNTNIAVIPGGLTSVLKPLDVCLNKPLKDLLYTYQVSVYGLKKITGVKGIKSNYNTTSEFFLISASP